MDSVAPTPRRWGPRVEYMAVKQMLLEGLTPGQMHDQNRMISRQFFIRLWDHWTLYEMLPHETRQWDERTCLSAQAMSNEIVLVLKHCALTHPSWYLDEYSDWLEQNGHGRFHPSTISRRLRSVGLSLTVLDEVAQQRDQEERARFLDEIHSVQNLDQFVCIDETNRDRNAGRRRRGWGPRGKARQLIRRFHGSGDELLYTMIAAVDVNGFIVEACRLIMKPQTNDALSFTNYIRECIIPILGNYVLGEPRSVLTLDNASVHNVDEVEALINDAGARVIWTARYSPDLHPIETAFNQYKAALKRSDEPSLFEAHLGALQSVSRENMMNYFTSQWGFTNEERELEGFILLYILSLDQ